MVMKIMVMKIMLYIAMTIKMTTAAVINKGHLLSTQIDCVEFVQFVQFYQASIFL